MNFKGAVSSILVMGLLFSGCSAIQNSNPAKQTSGTQDIAQVIEFPSNKYPETAAHIKDAIASGKTDICTIDRGGAAERRKQSLANVPTKKDMIGMNILWTFVVKAEKVLILGI